MTFRDLSFATISATRERITPTLEAAATLDAAAQTLVQTFATMSPSCVLARVFIVVPERRLPAPEREWAAQLATSLGRGAIDPNTSVLSLLATAGVEPAWNDRRASAGHRAIPLFDRTFVEGAPMISALLRSFKLDLGDGAVQIRSLPGGLNARFLVEDGATTVDAQGRHIIAAREFVEKYRVKSVFGMGGSYVGGELAVAIVFTSETLAANEVDRYTPYIGTFKMATATQLADGKLFA